MKGLSKALNMGALILALSGCKDDSFKNSINAISRTTPYFLEKEGRIIKVQPTQTSYTDCTLINTRTYDYPFEYVILKTIGGEQFSLIYPFPKGIPEGEVEIRYQPTDAGVIDSQTILNAFNVQIKKEYLKKHGKLPEPGISIDQRCAADYLLKFETDGIILKNGIEYK